jgi:uncharacterized protein YjdB
MNKVLKTMATMLAIATFAATLVSCDKNEDSKAVEVTSVKVHPAALTLGVGAKQTLTATVEPANASNKSVIWSSSAKAVADVDESTGEVTAKAIGQAIITVYAANNKTATCVVTVLSRVIVVTSVTVTPAELTLAVGDKQTLAATVEPADATDKTVTWDSSAETVAAVDAATGEVTAKAIGSATITATAGDKTATCTVTVTASIIEVTSVAVTPTELTLSVGDKQTLTATVEPADASNKTVTWSSSNPDIAAVGLTGEVTAKAGGDVIITVATQNGKTATCKVTVIAPTINVSSVTVTPTELTLGVGAKQTLTATVAPADATDKTVTWSSNAEAVAVVDESTGEVTAKAIGNAIITATTTDGGKTATCAVTVIDPNLVASWRFDDPSDFTKATIGQPLVAVGSSFSAVSGGVRVGLGSYYKATHGMSATTGGVSSGRVCEYTLLVDYKLTVTDGSWYSVFQSDLGNGGDADLWIDSSNGSIGLEYYSGASVIPLETTNYHRLVVAFKLPNLKVYVDGALKADFNVQATVEGHTNQNIYDRMSWDPTGVLFFADASGWDTAIDVSTISVWNKQLNQAEVTALGEVHN